MKKTLLSIAAITVSLNAAVAQNGITEIPDADHNGLTITAMSPNAKFVAGSNASTFGGFIFDLENDKIVNFDVNPSSDPDADVDLQIKAIANNGLAVGWNGPAATFDFNTQKCTTYGATDQYLFNGISPSGGYIVGARYDGTQTEGTPCIFHDGTPRDLPLPSNSFLGYESAGAAALSVADNGTISGYFVDDMATRPATTWALLNDGSTFFPYPVSRPYFAASAQSAKPYAMFSCDQTTMSPNGKWLIINYEKFLGDSGSLISTARYNLQTDEVEFFTPNEDDERFAEVGAEVYGFGIDTPRRLRRGLLQYALRHLCRRTLHSRLRIHLARRPGRGRILPLLGARHTRPRRRRLRYSRRSYRRQRQRQGSKDKSALLARRRSTQHTL